MADVATSRKRLELQMTGLQQQSDKLQNQAQKAIGAGREDLAREALTRRSGLQAQMGDLQAQHAQLDQEEQKLITASQRLSSKVESFRTRKETIKATYTAAEAQTKINEAFSGISEEMGDVGLAIQRAEEKTENMKARAGAIDELLRIGRARRLFSGLHAMTSRPSSTGSEAPVPAVDLELEQMKAELGMSAPPPKQIDAGQQHGQPEPQQQATAEQQGYPQQQGYPPPAPRPQHPGEGSVIVRIMGEGQLRRRREATLGAALNSLDGELEDGDGSPATRQKFRTGRCHALLERVRTVGETLRPRTPSRLRS